MAHCHPPCGHPEQPEHWEGGRQVTTASSPEPAGQRRAKGLKYYLLSFLTFFGLYAASSTCPFCGKPGCPVGVGGAAVVGGTCAALWQYGQAGWRWLTRRLRPNRLPKRDKPHVVGQDR